MASCSRASSASPASSKPFRKRFGAGATCKRRWRTFSAAPQVEEQALQSSQSAQRQYTGSWQRRVQLPTSSEACAWHAVPPQLASLPTWRKRLRSPPHLSQALHSPQSSHEQSCGWHSAEQGARAQPSASDSASWQGAPPFAGGESSCRSRVREPPPQLALHVLHAAQGASWQSVGGGPWHACGTGSPGEGLQGEVSFSEPWQNLPSPLPCVAMLRERRFTPLHVPLQALQAPHSEKEQSTDGSHGTSSLQLA
mmetsp:Transcript_47885/g.147682  ORF Transcript_47885/g.147682 Transcript_47885/m.147682 type:complete len:253 (+) Transcript_47885:299-1057(+)